MTRHGATPPKDIAVGGAVALMCYVASIVLGRLG